MSLLAPISSGSQDSYWKAPSSTSAVEFVIVLSQLSDVSGVLLLVSSCGYSMSDAPIVSTLLHHCYNATMIKMRHLKFVALLSTYVSNMQTANARSIFCLMLMISCTFNVEIDWLIFIYLAKEDDFFLLTMFKMLSLKFVAPQFHM